MAVTVVELPEDSASTSFDEAGVEKHDASRKFVIYDAALSDSSVTLNIAQAVYHKSLPQMGDEHPDFVGTLRVVKRAISRMADRHDSYSIAYTYEPMLDEPQAGIEISSSTAAEFVDKWRTDAIYPLDVSDPSDTLDVGGTKIDSGGEPTSALQKQQTYDTSFETPSVDVPTLFEAMGKRNDAVWQGFEKGTLVYLGVSVSQSGAGLVKRSDKFLYDFDYHLRQTVAPGALDGDLNPTLDSSGNATTIVWRQPFPETTSFDSLGIPV